MAVTMYISRVKYRKRTRNKQNEGPRKYITNTEQSQEPTDKKQASTHGPMTTHQTYKTYKTGADITEKLNSNGQFTRILEIPYFRMQV